MKKRQSPDMNSKETFVFQEGKLYFQRATERRIYFLLTVALAILGILAKTGLL